MLPFIGILIDLEKRRIIPKAKKIAKFISAIKSIRRGEDVPLTQWSSFIRKLVFYPLLNKPPLASFWKVYRDLPKYRHRKYVTEPREQISFQPTTEHAEELRKIAGLLTLASVDLNQPMVPHIMAFYASCVAGTVEVCTPTAGKAFQFWEKAVKRTTSKSLTSEVDEDIDQLV